MYIYAYIHANMASKHAHSLECASARVYVFVCLCTHIHTLGTNWKLQVDKHTDMPRVNRYMPHFNTHTYLCHTSIRIHTCRETHCTHPDSYTHTYATNRGKHVYSTRCASAHAHAYTPALPLVNVYTDAPQTHFTREQHIGWVQHARTH